MAFPDPSSFDAGRPVTRRTAVAAGLAMLLLPLGRVPFARTGGGVPHPEPRPGITGEAVLDPGRVPERQRDAYEAARAIPEVLDGIYCHCACAEHRGLRSLLSCFEGEMPLSCGICTGEARLAHRLHRQGKPLAAIRDAIDAAYARG